MVFGGEAFGTGLHHEGRALINRISALKRPPRTLPPVTWDVETGATQQLHLSDPEAGSHQAAP